MDAVLTSSARRRRCVPLYPPMVVYQALMGEPRSRVAACNIPFSLPTYKVRKARPVGPGSVGVQDAGQDQGQIDAAAAIAC